MKRDRLISEISQRLGRRKLIWIGIRGADAAPLLSLPQFKECFSVIAPLDALSIDNEVCLELMSKKRVDLDSYSLDEDASPQALEFRRKLYDSLSEPCAVVMYRTGALFTSAYYPRSDTTQYLGNFHERQMAFEYKPWVESELAKLGVPTVPWKYVRDDDRLRFLESLGLGPTVIRTSRTDGGVGLRLINDEDDMHRNWPSHTDGFVSVAPYLHPNIPLNVNACVFRDGSVSLHSPSLQLIGIPSLTTRRFGYCGNDFARVRELPAKVLDSLEEIVVKTGRWLASMGYLGAFGVDALVHESKVLLTEVNPRFQGSTALSAILDAELGRPDMILTHIASYLGIQATDAMHLKELAAQQSRMSQAVFHNCTSSGLVRKAPVATDGLTRYLLTPRDGIAVLPNAILAKAYISDSVTEDGLQISDAYRDVLKGFEKAFFRRKSISGRA